MGSHRPVPAVCLVVAGCSNYSEYRLFSLSENVLSRSFLRWAISSPMVRGGLVLFRPYHVDDLMFVQCEEDIEQPSGREYVGVQ